MMVGAILTLLMMRPGGATWLAAGETPVPPPDRGSDSAAGLSAPPPRRDLEGWRQALGLGWHGTTFSSKEGSHYTFQSASLGYLASFESRGMFVHGFVLLPLQTQQDGRVSGAGEFYRVRVGGDALLGWQWRFGMGSAVEGEAGPGLHGTFLWLRGKVGYRDFSALLLGVGGAGTVRWRPGAHLFSRPIDLGLYGSAALDVYDPLRANDLAQGLTFRVGLLAGLEAG